VLDGIHQGLRRCHLDLGLPWKVVAIHPIFAVALGLSVGRSAYPLVASIGSPVGLKSVLVARISPSGSCLASIRAAGIVERFVDLRRNP
jgi:hypothetical protein